MQRKNYVGLLKKIEDLTPRVRALDIRVEDPEGFQFIAGQFMMLHVPHEGKIVKRAYSIASDDRDKTHYKLLIKLIPGGVASEYVRQMTAGIKLEFSGPFGKLVLQEPPPEQVIFVCTGAGVSQHMSFLTSRCHLYPKTHFRMLFGVWNEGELFFETELKNVKNSMSNFEYQFVLDSPTNPKNWTGLTGKVTDHLCTDELLKFETTYYLCGNPAMITAVRDCLMDKYKVPKTKILAEAFR